MNIKILSLAFICLVFSFCASPARQKIWVAGEEILDFSIVKSNRTEKSILIEDRSFDKVWDTCEKVLIRLEYQFFRSDKATGEFLVKSTGLKAEVSFEEGRIFEEHLILLISLSRRNGKISITCTVWGSGIPEEDAALMERRELNRFLEIVQKDLKK